MDIIADWKDKARKAPRRIVFPEGEDERILGAARTLADEKLGLPILVGSPDALKKAADDAGVSINGIETIDPADESIIAEYSKAYAERRSVSENVARRLIRKPLFVAAMTVAVGKADGMVGGVATPTARVIMASETSIGLAPGIKKPSSFFVMIFPARGGADERVLLFADCAVNPHPNPEELAGIAIATADNGVALLNIEPRIAFLSFSTLGSAQHADVDKVREALKIARELRPDLAMEGEFQLDSAINPGVAKKKAPESSVAGKANVLVFPDLDAGNIGYKLGQHLGGAKAYGPVMQGFARPVNDLSRGASVDDIVMVSVITGLQSQKT